MSAGTRPEGLLSLLPPIRRARLWRLYAQNGRRYLDFWMDDGRDILGAKGSSLGTVIKAAVDMGVSRPLPSHWRARLEKQVDEHWPGYSVQRFFLNEERARAALGGALGTGAAQAADLVLDPARPGAADPARTAERCAILRPFGSFLDPDGRLGGSAGTALVRLPCSRMFAPSILLIRDAGTGEGLADDLIPPLMLAVGSRSLRELRRMAGSYGESLWSRLDRRLGPFFIRRGPYLYPRHGPAAHEAAFRAALEAGALLSPRWELPSLVPGDFDDGEIARLAAALQTAVGARIQ
ncbi:MAG TPA: hypothetical protein VMC79_12165 [Rectinemataceae bacterium]|nr:hypothetical protein [Rectinemataceae bacterium]